jgi:sulfotransferase family protein
VNPCVFIVGCSRSGTTLLRRILDAHPELAIAPETTWIPRFYRERRGIDEYGRVSRVTVEAVVTHPRFEKLRLDPDYVAALADGGVPYSAFVSSIFDLYGQSRRKALVGDKTPSYVRDIATLHRLWPDAKFVHIVRDGRDVCLSALEWHRKAEDFARRLPTWRDDPLVSAALWWKRHVLLGRRAGLRLGSDLYREVRYEALVADPEAETQGLCAFLHVPYRDAMLMFHEGRTKGDPKLSAKRAWLPISRGLRDWRTQMAGDGVEAVEAAVGDALDELGFARASPAPGLAARARAARVAATCEPRLPTLDDPFPAGW